MKALGHTFAGEHGYALGQQRIEAEPEVRRQFAVIVEMHDLSQGVHARVRPARADRTYRHIQLCGKGGLQAFLHGNKPALALESVKIAAVIAKSKLISHQPINPLKASTIYASTPPQRYLSKKMRVTNAAKIKNATRSRHAKRIFFILVRLGLA